jgi:hypothetical protein
MVCVDESLLGYDGGNMHLWNVGLLQDYMALYPRRFSSSYSLLWELEISHGSCLRFQVLTAASMMFRVVFWDILPCKGVVGTSVLLRTTQPSARPVVTSRSHWYHPGLSTRPFQGLSCIHFTSSPDILLSLLLEPPAHCHWPVPSLSSLTTTGHHGTGHLHKPRSFRARLKHPWWWRQYAPLKRRSTIILRGSISQKTTLNSIKLVDVFNGEVWCSLWGTDLNLKYYLRQFCFQRVKWWLYNQTWIMLLGSSFASSQKLLHHNIHVIFCQMFLCVYLSLETLRQFVFKECS